MSKNLALIHNSGLDDADKTKLLNSARPNRILSIASNEAVQIGDSKFGGLPHMPHRFPYPNLNNHSYGFIGQINLQEMSLPDLPESGILYFFVESDTKTFGAPHKVLYIDANRIELTITKPRLELKNLEMIEDAHNENEVKIISEEAHSIDKTVLDDIYEFSKEKEIERIISEEKTGRAHLMGNFQNWRIKEIDWLAYLASQNLDAFYFRFKKASITRAFESEKARTQYFLTELEDLIQEKKESLARLSEGHHLYNYYEAALSQLTETRNVLPEFLANVNFHIEASKKWKLLLHMNSISEAGIRFGDGQMHFVIHENDLNNFDFSKTFCLIHN